MKTKDKVLEILKRNGSRYTSGEEMANELFVTRAAVWKAINSLRLTGYELEAVTNKGYRLIRQSTPLDRKKIVEKINFGVIHNGMGNSEIFVYDEVSSTNEIAKEYGENNPYKEAVFIAQGQSKGKGRRGRPFYSPKGTGIYLSFLLCPNMNVQKALSITCIMAVAVCRAILEITGIETDIKWVNDIYYNGKKIGGILTEGITSVEDSELKYVVAGVGINIYEPYSGFPKEIKNVAGALLKEVNEEYIREYLCSSIINNFYKLIADNNYIEEYKKRSMLVGKYVKIVKHGMEIQKSGKEYAYVLGIDDNCHLLVRYDNGSEDILSTGEVSVVKY